MRRLISELWHGNLAPQEKEFIRGTDYDKAVKIISENEELLLKMLSGKEKELFLDFTNAQSELNGIVGLESFVAGFRIGGRFILEMLEEDDGCFRDIT